MPTHTTLKSAECEIRPPPFFYYLYCSCFVVRYQLQMPLSLYPHMIPHSDCLCIMPSRFGAYLIDISGQETVVGTVETTGGDVNIVSSILPIMLCSYSPYYCLSHYFLIELFSKINIKYYRCRLYIVF